MGASREAAIKVTLSDGAFIAGLRGMTEATKSAAHKMGHFISEEIAEGWHEGKKEAKESIREMGHKLTEVMKLAAEIGGGFAIGEFVKEAVEMEAVSGRVAGKLRAMGQRATELRDPLNLAREAAEEFSATEEDMLTGYEELLDKTGDPIFSKESLESVAMFGNAFRLTGTESADIVAMLHKKLGATTEQIINEFGPALMDATSGGAFTMKDLSASGEELGRNMLSAGLHGAEGFKQMVGMINKGKDESGGFQASMMANGRILTQFHNAKFLQTITKQLHGAKTGAKGSLDAFTNLSKILGHVGGAKAIRMVISGRSPELAAALNNLLKPFDDAVNEGKAHTKDATELTKMGAEAFDASLESMARSNNTAEDFKREAAKRAEESGRKMQLAIDRMKSAFTDERFLKSMEKLAAAMPEIADAFVKIIQFATAHPLMAAGGAVGAQVATSLVTPIVAGLAMSTAKKGAATTLGGVAATYALPVVAGAALIALGLGARSGNKDLNMLGMANEQAGLASNAHTPEQKAKAMSRMRALRTVVEKIDGDSAFDAVAQMAGAKPMAGMKAETLAALDEALTELAGSAKNAHEAQEKFAKTTGKATDGVKQLGATATGIGTTRGPMPQGPIAPGAAGE